MPSLDADQQKRYDEILSKLGKERADAYANRIAPALTKPVTPPAPVTSLKIDLTPPARTPDNLPLGVSPPSVPLPALREQRLDRVPLDTIKLDQDTLAQKALDVKIIVKQRQGMSYKDARDEALKEIDAAKMKPRTIEYRSPPSPFGYSELAVRGEELLPKLSTMEVAAHALTPQALETAEQAEGRHEFEKAKRVAKQGIEQRAKASGRRFDDQAKFEIDENFKKAQYIALQTYGTETTPERIAQTRAALNAPYYAAIEDFEGQLPENIIGTKASDILRGLTQKEQQGRLVETQGAAALRVLGGLTRFGTEAIRIPVEYGVSEVVGAMSPHITAEELREQTKAAEMGKRVSGPGVEYEPGWGERQRIETGSYLKNVYQQVSTGRSAMDDWYDAGVGAGGATVLGLVTEIGLPMTPLGYVTDVPKALGAAKAVSKLGNVVGDVTKTPRLSRMITETGRSMETLGFAMKKPSWWQTMTKATDVRVSMANDIAKELSDVAAIERALKSANPNDIVDAITTAVKVLPEQQSGFMKNVMNKFITADGSLMSKDDIIKSGVIQQSLDEIGKALGGTGDIKAGDVAPDIIRNTYAAALKDTNKVGEVSEKAVRAAIAETLEKVPDAGWSFVTPRLAVKKTVIASKPFQEAVGEAVKKAARANPNISAREIETVVEDTIKQNFKGSLAEPVAVAPPRVGGKITGRLLPEAPRGGLERIATPEAKAVPVIEVAQDVWDTMKVVVAGVADAFSKNPTKRVADAFSNSKFVGSMSNTLEGAMTVRMPVEMRDFIEATASEINALGSTFGGRVTKGGPIIGIMRQQGGFQQYLNARVYANVVDDPTSVRAGVTQGQTPQNWSDKPAHREGAAKIVEKIVRDFFGSSGIDNIITPTFADDLTKIANSSVESTGDLVEAVTLAIADARKKFPALKGVGRSTGVLQDDIVSASLEWAMGEEARVIFSQNLSKSFPDVVRGSFDIKTVMSDFQGMLKNMGVSDADMQIVSNNLNNMLLEKGPAASEAFSDALLKVVKQSRADAVLQTSHDIDWGGIFNTLSPSGHFFADILTNTNMSKKTRAAVGLAFIDAVTKPAAVDNILLWAAENRLIRQINENDVMEFVSNTLKLPITSTERKIIESLTGPINELSKGTGAIANNLSAIQRAGNGMSTTLAETFAWLNRLVRTSIRTGLTTGVLPNIRFAATNYLTAPMLMGMTAPGLAMRATMSEVVGKFGISMGDLSATNASFVRKMAKGDKADNIAFTTNTGIPYTYKQLNDFMAQNHFGMTQSTFDFGGNFADDVRIAMNTGPGGKAAKSWEMFADRAKQQWNVNGTNISTTYTAFVDTDWRQQVFLGALKKGETLEGAKTIATNAVLDYGRIPVWMRQKAAKWMTFFSWFTVSNAELFSLLFRPKAVEAVARTIQAQRTVHRGMGEWQYADDDFKSRMFSFEVGEYDDMPAFAVGPKNPVIDPLISQTTLVLGLMSLIESDASLSDKATTVGVSVANVVTNNSFTPFLSYLNDLGLFGEGEMSTMVPARQIAFHQALGDEHFTSWIVANGVVPVEVIPEDKRRRGEPTFQGQQYKFKDDASKQKAATMDAAMMVTGLGRALNDFSQLGLISGVIAPEGVDLKRYSDTKNAVFTWMIGGGLTKGTEEYDRVKSALDATDRELREMTKEN